MNQTLQRVFVMLCAGAGVWVLVFWLYEPAGPTVTYGGAPNGVRGGGTTLAQLDSVAEGPQASDTQVDDEIDTLDPTLARPEVQPERTPPVGKVPPTTLGDTTTFALRVVAPEFWEYTVQRGDNSWETIAEKTLGDRKLASAVLRANPLVSPDKLIPGRTRLKIPRDPRNIQGKVVTEPVAPPGAAAGTPTTAEASRQPDAADAGKPDAGKPGGGVPGPMAAPVSRSHTVAKGETLSQIAQTYLGSPAKWREIYELNKGVIPDPDRLKLGTVLKIPGEKPKP